ncbi:MAG: hypothetical protein M3O46_23195 [Myxococcota bacterium]|nr:hypothetical protein [Myxococcota bacterium]
MRSTNLAGLMLVATPFVLFSGEAGAQAPQPANDKVAAQALFEDGRKLVNAENYAEACPKFADSERLDPSPSTLLNLANCWEKLGRSATAWATYKEAESAANAVKRPDYMATAQRHADALSPKLSRLTIHVQQPTAGLQVKRDGTWVGIPEWGSAIPVDPGAHAVEASAAGYKPWTTNVDVARDGAQLTVSVPPLDPLPVETPPPAGSSHVPAPVSVPVLAPSSSPSPGPEGRSDGSTQRTIGLIVAGAGAVGLVVSGALALVANAKKQDSFTNCEPDPHRNVCNATGVSQRDAAISAGDAATAALGIGAVALVAGAVTWFTAPVRTPAPNGSAARMVILPTLGGAVMNGTW